MNPRMVVRVLAGAGLASVAYVTVMAAQTSAAFTLPDVLNGIGWAASAGALIAWGSQKERIQSHSDRLTMLEDDRVTRSEFETMGTTIRSIENEMRSMREGSAANFRQVLEMLERRQSRREP